MGGVDDPHLAMSVGNPECQNVSVDRVNNVSLYHRPFNVILNSCRNLLHNKYLKFDNFGNSQIKYKLLSLS